MLVVDLDETLIHYNEKESVVHERAYVGEFLQRMAKIFEVVIFTAGTKAYADNIIDSIDPEHCVSFRLYRNHITLHEGAPIKDLSKLGRELNRTIIIDNLSSNFRLQPDNGILISSWYG